MKDFKSELHDFIASLRENGLAVNSAQLIDVFRALELSENDVLSKAEDFRALLELCLLKDFDKRRLFHELFALHFTNVIQAVAMTPTSVKGDAASEAENAFTKALQAGDVLEMWALLKRSFSKIDSSKMKSKMQVGFFAERLLDAAGAKAVFAENAALDVQREAVKKMARSIVENALQKKSAQHLSFDLKSKPFHRLSDKERDLLTIAIERLAKALMAKKRKRDRSRRGQLQMRAMMRKSFSTDGVLMKPLLKRVKRERAPLYVLADISDSVQHTSFFTLRFLFELASFFSEVRVFAFVQECSEITDILQSQTLEAAKREIESGQRVRLYGNSDYKAAFGSFVEKTIGSMRSNTHVIVIGDGRNNYGEKGCEHLEVIARHSKSLIWFCSEQRSMWDAGDSEMNEYDRVVSKTHCVRNLRDLEHAIDDLKGVL